jgi:hypothetical protein
MTNTTFSIELNGILLPDSIKDMLEAELRSVVLAQIAKVDLGKELSVQPLPGRSERSSSRPGPILGFVVKNVGKSAERSTGQPGSSLVDPTSFLDPHYLPLKDQLQDAFGSPTPQGASTDGTLSPNTLHYLYYRPDIRAAVVSNSRAFAELLSQDEQAVHAFKQLTGGADSTTAPTERYAAAVGVALVSVGVGILVGGLVNKK